MTFWKKQSAHSDVAEKLLKSLCLAAISGDAAAIKAAIAGGADVNAKYGRTTALMNSAEHGHADVAKALNAAGADPKRKGRPRHDGWSPAALLAPGPLLL